MKHHYFLEKTLPYPAPYLYNLVADVQRYAEFVPWVSASRVISSTSDGFIADLDVGYGLLGTTYRSHVTLEPYQHICATCDTYPFKHLAHHWYFSPRSSQQTQVKIDLVFELAHGLLSRILTPLLTQAPQKIMTSFEKRAENPLVSMRKI